MSIQKSLKLGFIKHRGQEEIQRDEGTKVDSTRNKVFFEKAYDNLEVVRRGTDLIVNSAAEIDISIVGALSNMKPVHENARKRMNTLYTILNFRPNENEDTNSFRRQLYTDLVLTGNCYQYYDGDNLYHLPAHLMTIETDSKRKVKYYELNSDIKFFPNEIIHVRDNSSDSVYRGISRLVPARQSMITLQKMLNYQENFFKNNAIPGLIITTPNILGDRIKQKLLQAWRQRYNPETGGRNPMILDGDLKVNPLSQTKFSELDFEVSVNSHQLKILKTLGVPPVLLDSGNNANLRPNIQLFYDMTVLPMVKQMVSAYERFFAYDVDIDVAKVRALRPELKEAAQYYQGLVNTGIMTINEARVELRLDPSTEAHASELRIPQNIAGSAENPAEGGRPPSQEDENE